VAGADVDGRSGVKAGGVGVVGGKEAVYDVGGAGPVEGTGNRDEFVVAGWEIGGAEAAIGFHARGGPLLPHGAAVLHDAVVEADVDVGGRRAGVRVDAADDGCGRLDGELDRRLRAVGTGHGEVDRGGAVGVSGLAKLKLHRHGIGHLLRAEGGSAGGGGGVAGIGHGTAE